MTDYSHDPSAPPPLPPASSSIPAPEDYAPITSLVSAAEVILRQPQRLMHHLSQPRPVRLILRLLVVSIGCSLCYGLVVGTFSMHAQLWAAPLKIAGGLLLSGLICLPSLYIFSCLSGSRAGLAEIAGLISGLLLLTALLLLGFAPVAWLFAQSTSSVTWMGVLHLAFWAVAVGFGLRFLEAGFVRSRPRSQAAFQIWVVVYLLVALQMTTALRPIVGTADTFLPQTRQSFVSHWNDCLWGRQATR